jgi:hypothetical protein
MSDTPRTDKVSLGYLSNRSCGTEAVSIDFARQLERELSAANARIAELEEAVRRNGIKVSAPLGSLLSPHDITEPFQPTTLPESKQQK